MSRSLRDENDVLQTSGWRSDQAFSTFVYAVSVFDIAIAGRGIAGADGGPDRGAVAAKDAGADRRAAGKHLED
jgi:hypothetical protein